MSSPKAFILGGSGQIGRAVAGELAVNGWDVAIGHRGTRPLPENLVRLGVREVTLDRTQPGGLARVLADGYDALIDTVAYTEADARELVSVRDCIGRFVVVSSASVYCDDAGRTLDEAGTNGFPELPYGIAESQPTVEGGPQTYSTRKVAMERVMLEEAPTIVLRPCAVHGIGSRHPREWWFVKRAIDGRSLVPLAYQGVSRFQTSSTLTIARFVRFALARELSGIYNVADKDAPNVLQIGTAIGEVMKASWTFVPIVGDDVGATPWSVRRPFVVDAKRARETGFAEATAYAETLQTLCAWLVQATQGRDWHTEFPVLAAYPENLFDYVAEDRFLAGRGNAPR